jgi:hypothetical protein
MDYRFFLPLCRRGDRRLLLAFIVPHPAIHPPAVAGGGECGCVLWVSEQDHTHTPAEAAAAAAMFCLCLCQRQRECEVRVRGWG